MPQVGCDPLAVKDDLCEHCHQFTPEATMAGLSTSLVKITKSKSIDFNVFLIIPKRTFFYSSFFSFSNE